jgi:hypothetical protein
MRGRNLEMLGAEVRKKEPLTEVRGEVLRWLG